MAGRYGYVAAVVAVFGLLAQGARAQDVQMPESFKTETDEAKTACETDGGTFTVDPGTYQVIDVNGDGALDQVLDEGGFSCTTGETLYCSASGCPVHFIISGVESALALQDWKVVNEKGTTFLQAPGDIGTLDFTWNPQTASWDIRQN